MAKTKKMTFNMLAVGVEKAEPTSVAKFNEHELIVKTELDLVDSVDFVGSIVESCIDQVTGMYNPEVFDFACRVNTLVFYAGVQTPTDLDKAWDVVYHTDLVSIVMRNIEPEKYVSLIDAAKKRIEFLKDVFVAERASVAHNLLARIDKMISDSNNALDELNSEEFKQSLGNMLRVISGGDEQPDEEQKEEDASVDDGVEAEPEKPNNIIVLKRGE